MRGFFWSKFFKDNLMSLSRDNQDLISLIYADVTSANKSNAVAKQNINVDLFFALEMTNENAFALAHANIKKLETAGYDYSYRVADKVSLVRNLIPEANLDPTHSQEAKIQSLRFLRGILLIQKNSTEASDLFFQEIKNIYAQYESAIVQFPKETIAYTELLNTQFVELIEKYVGKNGLKQLVMAKDLSILLEDHPDIYTISKLNKKNGDEKITIEKTSLCRLHSDCYLEFETCKDKLWFQLAKESIGFANVNNTWLDKVFSHHLNEFKTKAVSAPPTARWLPIPANHQTYEIYIFLQNKSGTAQLIHHKNLTRVGTLCPYDIKNEAEQLRLARLTLFNVFKKELMQHITEFKNKYKAILPTSANIDFFCNYQSLLSPLIGVDLIPHKENNVKFVSMSKEAFENVKSYYKEHPIEGVNLHFYQTNRAINKNAHISHSYKMDEFALLEKMQLTESFLANIPDISLPLELENELSIRFLALQALKEILDNKENYKHLHTYQLNLMLATLEYFLMGKQGFNLVSCKSTRDRTTAFIVAMVTILKNHNAMLNWTILSMGMAHEFMLGHTFRAMQYHCAIIKLKAVHKEYMLMLRENISDKINLLKQFGKKPKLLSNDDKHRLMMQLESPYNFIFRNNEEDEKDLPLSKTPPSTISIHRFFAKLKITKHADNTIEQQKINVIKLK